MLDPVKNAKVVGVLFLLGAIFGVFGLFITLALGSTIAKVLVLISTLLTTAVAVGLLMSRRWAIYCLGLLILMDVVKLAYNLMNGSSLNITYLAELIISGVIFLWFYTARSRFN